MKLAVPSSGRRPRRAQRHWIGAAALLGQQAVSREGGEQPLHDQRLTGLVGLGDGVDDADLKSTRNWRTLA